MVANGFTKMEIVARSITVIGSGFLFIGSLIILFILIEQRNNL
jgi:hypothetical protein